MAFKGHSRKIIGNDTFQLGHHLYVSSLW